MRYEQNNLVDMKAKIFFLLLFSGFFVLNSSACTIFSGIDNRGHVLVSNNEDHIPNMSIFFKVRMATDSTYGYFGTIYNHPDGWLQGGSNDQGLFFDTNELGYVPLRKTAGTQPSDTLGNCQSNSIKTTDQQYSGKYLFGEEGYLEFFPAKDVNITRSGAAGFGFMTFRSGDI